MPLVANLLRTLGATLGDGSNITITPDHVHKWISNACASDVCLRRATLR